MIVLLCLTFLTFSQNIKVVYTICYFTTVNYYDNELDSALVEQLISQIDTSDIVGDFQTEQTIIYPQIYGLKNKKLQDSLNSEFRFNLRYNTGDGVVNTIYIASGQTANLKVDSSKVKIIRKFNSKHFPDEYSVFNTSTTVFVTDNRYLSICTREEQEGNMAAHPNFSEYNDVLDLTNGEIVTLETLFEGNYLEDVKKIMKAKLFENDITESNNSMCTPKQTWIKSINSKTAIAKITSDKISLSADTRNFGCPEVSRNIMTIDIPLNELNKYRVK